MLCLLAWAPTGAPATMTQTYSPGDFGAAGDGKTDDTMPLQAALDALHPGDTLAIPEGATFVHSDVLTVRTPAVRVTGGGTLGATQEARSEVLIDSDDVTLEGVTLRMLATTRRWDAFEQMKLRLGGHSGITVRGVTIDGSAGAGVYVGTGASDFRLEDMHVQGTRADGIHVTGGAHDGVVSRPVVLHSGDDGVAVVSYESDGVPVRSVRIEGAAVTGNAWGRGISVVGGEDIGITDARVERSSAAALYIASEGAPYWTFAPHGIRVSGLVAEDANTDESVAHGAVLIYAGRAEHPPTDLVLSGLTIRGTRATAPWQVGVVLEASARVADVTMSGVSISGTGVPFAESYVGATCCTRTGWIVNGVAVADVMA